MVPECERAALLAHTAQVEQYKSLLDQERGRLIGLHADRFRSLTDGVLTGGRSLSSHEVEALSSLGAEVNAGVASYAEGIGPAPVPLDTPRHLREEVAAILECRVPALRWALRNAPPGSHDPDRGHEGLRDEYRRLRGRLLAFIRLAPTSVATLPERVDPIFGLQDILAWCESATGHPTCPPLAAAPGPSAISVSEQAEAERGSQERGGAPAYTASLDSRAVGIAHEMLANGEGINVAEVARRIGCERTKLYGCTGFMALVNIDRASGESAKKRLPRGTKDRRTRSVEARSNDD